jgi:hypothetical protein
MTDIECILTCFECAGGGGGGGDGSNGGVVTRDD